MKKHFKKLEFLIYTLLLFLTLVSAAQAASWDITSFATLGDDNQDRDEIAQSTISITNTDNSSNISNIQASFTASLAGFSNSDFNITFTGVPSQITANTASSITVDGFVPLDFDSGRRKIGTATFTADSGNSTLQGSADIYMEAQSMLEIFQVDVVIDGDDDEDIDEDDEPNAKRNDEVDFTVWVENKFDDNDEIEIQNVEVTIESDAFDDNKDTSDEEDIDTEEDFDFELNFDVDNDARDKRYTVTITAEGVDDNGAAHTDEFKFKLDVEVKDREITINNINVFPSNVCPGDSFRVDIEYENTGTRDLDEGVLYITVDELSYAQKIRDIEIRDGRNGRESFTLIVPKNQREGTYFIDVEAFWKDSSTADTDIENEIFTVIDCDDVSKDSDDEKEDSTTGFEVITQASPGATGQVFGVPAKTKSEFFESTAYLALLGITIFLVLILIILMLTSGKGDKGLY